MMPGPELLDRVAAEATRQRRPEGVSVLVVSDTATDDTLVAAARILARDQYPTTPLTTRVIGIFRDALGAGRHEVVLEVAR